MFGASGAGSWVAVLIIHQLGKRPVLFRVSTPMWAIGTGLVDGLISYDGSSFQTKRHHLNHVKRLDMGIISMGLAWFQRTISQPCQHAMFMAKRMVVC